MNKVPSLVPVIHHLLAFSSLSMTTLSGSSCTVPSVSPSTVDYEISMRS
jgi:hypothetical protein